MTTRDEFLNAKPVGEFADYSIDDDGYFEDSGVAAAWLAWQARQQEIDALKAEIEKLISNDHIADASKMILPPNQCEQQLNMVSSGNQDALDAARYRFLKANLVGGFDLPGLYSLDVIDHESWDETIDAAIQYAAGGDHE